MSKPKEKAARKFIATVRSKSGNFPEKHRSYALAFLKSLKKNDYDWGFTYFGAGDIRRKVGIDDKTAAKIEKGIRDALGESKLSEQVLDESLGSTLAKIKKLASGKNKEKVIKKLQTFADELQAMLTIDI